MARHSIVFPLYYVAWLTVLLSVLGAQIYRYRHISTPVERQQTKWVMWGLSTSILIALGVVLPHVLFPGLVSHSVLYQLLSVPADPFAIFLASLSIGLAILRSNLWEIDNLINRTLVYGALTTLLALVYVSLVVVLQALIRIVGVGISQSALVSVVSTLAIAALFQPLRRYLQQIIDRRFYRHKYDAEQALAEFGDTLRSEVGLSALCDQLVAIVKETMEPEHVSLWLVQPERRENRAAQILPHLPGEVHES
jgi:uncharacterized membrane protein YhiD involved in acid resistance